MIISGMDTSDVVLLLRDYYSIEKTLTRQGFTVATVDDASHVIATTDLMYEALKSRSNRQVLRAAYQDKCVTDDDIRKKCSHLGEEALSASFETLTAAGAFVASDGIVQPLANRQMGVTFEWFIAEAVKREMSGIASFGVHLEHLRTGGDYDVVARLDDVVVHIECKAGAIGGITQAQIAEFIKRDGELSPNLTLFVIDSGNLTTDFIGKWIEAGWKDIGMGECRPRLRHMRGRGQFYEASATKYVVTNNKNLISNIRLAVYHHHRWIRPFALMAPDDDIVAQSYDEYEK